MNSEFMSLRLVSNDDNFKNRVEKLLDNSVLDTKRLQSLATSRSIHSCQMDLSFGENLFWLEYGQKIESFDLKTDGFSEYFLDYAFVRIRLKHEFLQQQVNLNQWNLNNRRREQSLFREKQTVRLLSNSTIPDNKEE